MLLRVARWLGIAALFIGYPFLAHYTNDAAHSAPGTAGSQLGKWVAIAPVIVVALWLAWRARQRWVMLGVVGLCCVAVWAAWPKLDQHVGLIYWLEHATMQLMLMAMFGHTLFGGREPLCTYFSRLVHGSITPRHEIYARKVTVAWSVFFALIAVVSTLLFFLTPLPVWSFFANFVNMPLVLLMFAGEFVVRKRALPERQHSIFDSFRAMKRDSSNPQ
jgi:uncharacterized membrane protein